MHVVAKIDIATVAAGLVISLFAFDLFPGPSALLSLLVGGAGWLELRRGHRVGRRLLDVFVGMLLALAVVLFVALVVH